MFTAWSDDVEGKGKDAAHAQCRLCVVHGVEKKRMNSESDGISWPAASDVRELRLRGMDVELIIGFTWRVEVFQLRRSSSARRKLVASAPR